MKLLSNFYTFGDSWLISLFTLVFTATSQGLFVLYTHQYNDL